MTRPLILVSSPRCGTNFTLDVAGACLPRAAVLGEIFRDGSDTLPELSALTGLPERELLGLRARGQVELWDATRAAAEGQGRPLLAKIFYHHATRHEPIWRAIRRHARTLHLMRRNLLEAQLSLQLAKETGVWQLRYPNQVYQPRRVRVDPAEAEKFAQTRRNRIAWVRRFFAGPGYREAFYEDLEASPEHCAARLHALGLVPPPPPAPELARKVRFRRQRQGTLAERILNYDEVRHLDADEPDAPAPEAQEVQP